LRGREPKDRPLVEPFLVGPRDRLRPIEREDLPYYRELLGSVRFNLLAGGLGASESLGKLERRFDAGKFDVTDRYLCYKGGRGS
jgi:hypothetical protein